MAYYDYRPSYPSRPQETHSSRSRDYPQRGTRYGHSSSEPYYDQHRPYSIPTLPPRPTEIRPRRGTHRKHTWPPSPSVEDEVVSLAREYGPASSLTDDDDAVCMRGTIDQVSILEQVDLPSSKDNVDNRFVLVSESDRGHSSDRYISEDSGQNPGDYESRRLSLNTSFEDPISLERRPPSPYAYTKPAGKRTSGEYFLSPDAATTVFSSIPRSVRAEDEVPPAKPPRPSAGNNDTAVPGSYVDDAVEDFDADNSYVTRMREKGRSTRYSYTPTDSEKTNLKMSLHDTPTKPPPDDSGRTKNTPKTWTVPTPEKSASNSSHSSGPPTPGSHRQAYPQPAGAPRVHDNSGQNFESPSRRPYSRPSSPIVQDRPTPPSPSESPGFDNQGTKSRPGSRPGSRNGSPLNAYYPQYPLALPQVNLPYPQQDYDYSYPHNYNPDYTSSPMPPDRPNPRMAPPRIDVKSPSPARPADSVPYPGDDVPGYTYMPPETAYQYQEAYSSQRIPSVGQSPAGTPTTPSWHAFDQHSGWGRPGMHSQRSLQDGIPKSRPEPVRFASNDFASSSNDNSRSPTNSKNMPPCPRPEPTTKHEDWYALMGESSFTICPSCRASIVAPSAFSKHFRVHTRRSRNSKVQCNFALPWVRSTWSIILNRKYENLDLLCSLISLNIQEPCPGDTRSHRSWYGILDEYGEFVGNFYLCMGDKKRIEKLFPMLQGQFHRIPPDVLYSPRQLCSLRSSSKRFSKYIASLEAIDKSAYINKTPPETQDFVSIARDFANRRECARDGLQTDELWYFIPWLPDFTVCEECFEEVVAPAISDGVPLATEFNMTMRRVPSEVAKSGTSCQLYSPRMRRVWAFAAQDDDRGYLEQMVTERKNRQLVWMINQRELKMELAQMDKLGETDGGRTQMMLEEEEKQWREFE